VAACQVSERGVEPDLRSWVIVTRNDLFHVYGIAGELVNGYRKATIEFLPTIPGQ